MSIKDFFTFNWFKGFFSKQKESFIKVFNKIEPLAEKFYPIVQKIDAVVTAEAKALPSTALTSVATVLHQAVGVEGVVTGFLAANTGSTVGVILRDAAKLIMSYSSPTSLVGMAESKVNLAVETALNLLKDKQGK